MLRLIGVAGAQRAVGLERLVEGDEIGAYGHQERRLAPGRVLYGVTQVGRHLLIRQQQPAGRRVCPAKLLSRGLDRRDVVPDRPVTAEDDDGPKPAATHGLVHVQQQVLEGLATQPEHVAGHVVALPALYAAGQVAAVGQLLAPVGRPVDRRRDETARTPSCPDADGVRLERVEPDGGVLAVPLERAQRQVAKRRLGHGSLDLPRKHLLEPYLSSPATHSSATMPHLEFVGYPGGRISSRWPPRCAPCSRRARR